MQELRLVLIIIGVLAITMLLFHGLWTNRKERAIKFGKPSDNNPIDHPTEEAVDPEDDFVIIRKMRKEPDFENEHRAPLVDEIPQADKLSVGKINANRHTEFIDDDEIVLPNISSVDTAAQEQNEIAVSREHRLTQSDDEIIFEQSTLSDEPAFEQRSNPKEHKLEEEYFEVISIHVHCASGQMFNGRDLFNSMQQNGLQYGEMSIYHRYADLSGRGKVLFSVANAMQPGILNYEDIDSFTTLGLSFFMTLPCYGEADMNFKLMLKTAQQIADDLNGHVLDDQRNLMTPNRIATYHRQIREFIQMQKEQR